LIGECDVKAAQGLNYAYENFPNESPGEQGTIFVEWARQ
jgi:hypothetical protein